MTVICFFCNHSFPVRASQLQDHKSLKCPGCGQELNPHLRPDTKERGNK